MQRRLCVGSWVQIPCPALLSQLGGMVISESTLGAETWFDSMSCHWAKLDLPICSVNYGNNKWTWHYLPKVALEGVFYNVGHALRMSIIMPVACIKIILGSLINPQASGFSARSKDGYASIPDKYVISIRFDLLKFAIN